MLIMKPSPKNLGVQVCGTDRELEHLYEALHEMSLRTSDQLEADEPVDIRILGLAYDVRHARMGDRDYEWEENGWEAVLARSDERVAARDTHPRQNLLWSFPVLWPEMLFLAMALQSRLDRYIRNRSPHRHVQTPWMNSKMAFDPHVAAIWGVQSSLRQALEEVLTPRKYGNTLGYLGKGARLMNNYLTQYVDYWNLEFIDMSPTKRQDQLSVVAKRLSSQDDEYHNVMWSIEAFAQKHDIPPQYVRYGHKDYPDELEW